MSRIPNIQTFTTALIFCCRKEESWPMKLRNVPTCLVFVFRQMEKSIAASSAKKLAPKKQKLHVIADIRPARNRNLNWNERKELRCSEATVA